METLLYELSLVERSGRVREVPPELLTTYYLLQVREAPPELPGDPSQACRQKDRQSGRKTHSEQLAYTTHRIAAPAELYSAIQRYTALHSAIHYTVIQRYTLYHLCNTPLGAGRWRRRR